MELRNVLYIPELRRNLISVSKVVEDGVDIKVKPEAIILRQNDSEIRANKTNGLYGFSAEEPMEANAANNQQVSLKQAHNTFAHLNVEFHWQMLQNERYEVKNDLVTCSFCTRGKMRKASFRPEPESSISPRIGKIHSDVCSLNTPSFGGS